MSKTASGGNKKGIKKDQPKRKRYNFEARGFRRAVRDMEKHIAKYPNDERAKAALPRLRERAIKGKKSV